MRSCRRGESVDRDGLLRSSSTMQYTRNDSSFARGNVPRHGRTSRSSRPTRRRPTAIELFGDDVEALSEFDPLTGEVIADDLEHIAIFAGDPLHRRRGQMERAVAEIERRARGRCAELEREGKLLEAQRLRSAPTTTWR